MTIKVALEHRTSYAFDRPVKIFPHVVRLRPAPHSRTPIEAYSLKVEPAEHFLNWQQDAFSNYLGRLVFPKPSTSLSITVNLIADLTAINPFDFFIEEWAEHYGFAYPDDLLTDLEAYLRPIGVTTGEFAGAPIHPEVAAFAAEHKPTRRIRTIDFLVAINQAVQQAVGYTVRLEQGVQTPEHTLTSAIGSCRDSAWLLVALLRELGLAARFVSGYLVQLTSDIRSIDGPSGPDADFTDLHAWTEVYLPGAGWWVWIPPPGCSRGRATSRSPRRRVRVRRHRSRGPPANAMPPWTSPTPSPGSTRIRGSPCPTPIPSGPAWCRWGRRWMRRWPRTTYA